MTSKQSSYLDPSKVTSFNDITSYIDDGPWLGDYAVCSMMIYSEPGEGKTPLLGTVTDCERLMPALLIDCDSGTLSIRSITGLKTIHLDVMADKMSVELMEKASTTQERKNASVSQWGAIEAIYNWLRLAEHEYKTIMLDGASEIERFCEMETISDRIDDKGREAELAELGDYRLIRNRMKRMYMRFRDINTIDGRKINLFATAHEGRRQENSKIAIQPLFIGAGGPLISSTFDIIARLTREKDDDVDPMLVCKVHEQGKGRGRDRSGGISGGVIKSPTMSKIADAIWGESK